MNYEMALKIVSSDSKGLAAERLVELYEIIEQLDNRLIALENDKSIGY